MFSGNLSSRMICRIAARCSCLIVWRQTCTVVRNSQELVVSLPYKVYGASMQIYPVVLFSAPGGRLSRELLWDLPLVVALGECSGESSNAFGGFSRAAFQR